MSYETLDYDAYLEALPEQLANLSSPARAAFAMWMSERLLPAFEEYVRTDGRDPGWLRAVLDRLWLHTLGKHLTAEESADIQTQVTDDVLLYGCVIEDDEVQEEETYNASRTLEVVRIAFDACTKGLVPDIARAADYPMDIIDEMLTHDIMGHTFILTPEENGRLHEQILAHRLVKEEQAHQRQCLEFLRRRSVLTVEDVDELKRSAKNARLPPDLGYVC